MELKRSKADLSRRVMYYELPGLSFREYLYFSGKHCIEPVTIEQILKNHVELVNQFKGFSVQKAFQEYLKFGYYPFFLENKNTYLLKLNNVIEKVILEDILSTKNVKQGTITYLKKILWLIATSTCLIPNVDKISKNLGVTRGIVYDCLQYLSESGLTQNIFSVGKGNRQTRKPGKVFLENCNLLHAINGQLSLESDVGPIRETFFANQVSFARSVLVHDSGDFLVDNKWVFEIGGKNKTSKQVQGIKDSYLALDGIQVGFKNKIPLFLFGCLY